MLENGCALVDPPRRTCTPRARSAHIRMFTCCTASLEKSFASIETNTDTSRRSTSLFFAPSASAPMRRATPSLQLPDWRRVRTAAHRCLATRRNPDPKTTACRAACWRSRCARHAVLQRGRCSFPNIRRRDCVLGSASIIRISLIHSRAALRPTRRDFSDWKK